eukprot:644561-Amphidinium_carterae.1
MFHYADTYKNSYKVTAYSCNSVGVDFAPIVVETHSGAMSPALRSFVDFVARAHITFDRNACHQFFSLDIAQRIFVVVIRDRRGLS